MRLDEIVHLPDDILTRIFYFLKSPYNGLLVKNLYYIITNPFNVEEYLLLQKKNNPIMRGRWTSLSDRDWDFLLKRYNPYRLVDSIATPCGTRQDSFLAHLKSLKYLKLKTLRKLYPSIKATSKKNFIRFIFKE